MMRNATSEARAAMFKRIEEIAKGTAAMMGGSADVRFKNGYASVYNNERLADLISGFYAGFYTQKVPSCLIWIGTGGNAPNHNPGFMVEEPYIKLCTRAMALFAAEFLTSD